MRRIRLTPMAIHKKEDINTLLNKYNSGYLAEAILKFLAIIKQNGEYPGWLVSNLTPKMVLALIRFFRVGLESEKSRRLQDF